MTQWTTDRHDLTMADRSVRSTDPVSTQVGSEWRSEQWLFYCPCEVDHVNTGHVGLESILETVVVPEQH